MAITVAVICTVRDEAASIDRLLDSLLTQTRQPDELIFVDGGSSDDTVARLKAREVAGAPLRVYSAPGANISQGRNAAIRVARADVIASVDAGVRLEPGWLAALVRPFEAAGGDAVDVVCGSFRPDARTPVELAMGATTLPTLEEIDPDRFLPSSRSVAFRRRCWEAVAGYPEGLDYCEDLVFDLDLKRQGFRFVFAPDALVHFRPRSNLRAFFKQYYRYARGDGKADLWRRRHAIRYATYVVGPVVALLGFWYKLAWLAIGIAGAAYLYRPYRHLLPELRGRGRKAQAEAALLVPVVRLVGDAAKMIGYPVGVVWRLRRGPPAQTRPTRVDRV